MTDSPFHKSVKQKCSALLPPKHVGSVSSPVPACQNSCFIPFTEGQFPAPQLALQADRREKRIKCQDARTACWDQPTFGKPQSSWPVLHCQRGGILTQSFYSKFPITELPCLGEGYGPNGFLLGSSKVANLEAHFSSPRAGLELGSVNSVWLLWLWVSITTNSTHCRGGNSLAPSNLLQS